MERDFRLRCTEECERGCGTTEVKEAAAAGGDRLVMTGARAEQVAQLVTAATAPTG
ncbi:hypothetical protein [Roseomonas chloroacetimidivorans]|uniref:hypothetical protein n=1 Tax=Roseomonas chloroacetimidivorans TaxID=1766656 RepID=UPI003C7479AB